MKQKYKKTLIIFTYNNSIVVVNLEEAKLNA